MKDMKALTAPCGIDCFNCQVYEENISEEVKTRMAAQLHMEADQVPCKGCRAQKGCRLHYTGCATLDCVTAKGVEFCFECDEFPCPKLQPALDGAARYPHNMKVYNLCRIKAVGVEQWAAAEAAEIRQRYFKGKFVVGVGPTLE